MEEVAERDVQVMIDLLWGRGWPVLSATCKPSTPRLEGPQLAHVRELEVVGSLDHVKVDSYRTY